MSQPIQGAGAAMAVESEAQVAVRGKSARRAAKAVISDPFFSFLKGARQGAGAERAAERAADAKSRRAIKVGEGTNLHAAAQAALASLGAPTLEVALQRVLTGGTHGGANDLRAPLAQRAGLAGARGAGAFGDAGKGSLSSLGRGASEARANAEADKTALAKRARDVSKTSTASRNDADEAVAKGTARGKPSVDVKRLGGAAVELGAKEGSALASASFEAQLRQHAGVSGLNANAVSVAASRDLHEARTAAAKADRTDVHAATATASSARAADGAKPAPSATPAQAATATSTTAAAESSSGESAATFARALESARGHEGRDRDGDASSSKGGAAAELSSHGNQGANGARGASFEAELRGAAQPTALSAARQLAEAAAAKIPEAPTRFEVTLSPETLGQVDVRLQMRGDQLELTLRTEHGETRELLENGLADLRDALRERGIDLAGADVSTRDEGERRAQQFGGDGQGERAKHAPRAEDDATTSPASAPAKAADSAQATVAAPRIVRMGRVDVLA